MLSSGKSSPVRKPDITGHGRMTVLHVHAQSSWRGGEQQLAYLLEELDKQGINQVVACAKGSAFEQYCRDRQLNHVALPKRSAFSLSFARQVKRLCRTMDVSIIHCHDAHGHTFAVLAAAVFGNKVPVVISRRVDFPVKNSFFSRFKYNHSCIAAIICVSDKIREITGQSIRNRKVLTTVHSGINTGRFENPPATNVLRTEFNVPEGHAIIANVAALAPHKDYFTFVDTVRELVKRNLPARYFIIGDGPLKDEITDYVRQTGMNKHIIMTGFRDDIPSILPGVDIFLITSETEGLGTSILDAFACKVPVVATAAGGIPEIVIHEQTGLLAPVKDADKLASQAERLLNDQPLREKLIAGATQHLQGFTKEETGRKTVEVYGAIHATMP